MFHRVDDFYAMDGRRFLRLAPRIFAYDGVCAARARAAQPPKPDAGPTPREEAHLVDSTAEALRASPLGPYMTITQV